MRSGLSEPSPSSQSSHMSRSAKEPPSSDMAFASAFSSMEYNIRVGSGLATVQSAREPVSWGPWKTVQVPSRHSNGNLDILEIFFILSILHTVDSLILSQFKTIIPWARVVTNRSCSTGFESQRRRKFFYISFRETRLSLDIFPLSLSVFLINLLSQHKEFVPSSSASLVCLWASCS